MQRFTIFWGFIAVGRRHIFTGDGGRGITVRGTPFTDPQMDHFVCNSFGISRRWALQM